MENNKIEVIHKQEVLGNQFKIYGTKENPLFLAKDVANWIEHSKADVMLQSIDDEEKVKVNNVYVDGRTGGNGIWFLTEYGLYEVLMLSRKPIAKKFKKEVKTILKTIRTTGAYIMPGLSQEAVANIVSKIESTFNVLTHDNHVLREENEYLRQYEPKCDFGDDSEITGRAKWMIRRGAYVSGRGRKAKCLKPTGSGCIQLNLFDDYLPVKNIVESMKLLGVNEVNLSLV